MRAVRWHGREDVRCEDVSLGPVSPATALIKIERVGLCGSDVEQVHSGVAVDPAQGENPSAAMILGHELVGIVERCETRPELVGRRVIPDVVDGCGTCWWCRRHEVGLCERLVVRGQTADGGLAELFVARADTLIEVPDGVSAEIACFAEPLSVAVRALDKCGDLRGGVVAIIGMGVIGNLIAQVCLARGIAVVGVDPAAHTAGLAAEVDVKTVAPDQARAAIDALTAGRGADAVFECAGRSASFAQSPRLCRSGGTIVLVGIAEEQPPFAWRDAVLREIRYVGTAAHVWDTDVQAAVNLLAAGAIRVDHLLSRVIGLAEVPAVLAELAAPNTLAKVQVDPRIGGPTQ